MKKILSIDGGGIRGVIPSYLLQVIEERMQKPVSEIFDLIAGTSTGGILALCLTRPDDNGKPKYKAADILKLYEKEGKKIFHKSRWKTVTNMGNLIDEKFPLNGIEEVLSTYLGDTMLSEALTSIIVPSYELEQRLPYFFKSRKAKENPKDDFKMRDVARATSAAPTYFECLKLGTKSPLDYLTLIDGGVFANNPSMCAYAEAKKVFGKGEEIILVSIGTGQHTRPISYDDSRKWGLIGWTRPLLSIVFDGVSSAVEYQLKLMLNDDDTFKKYFRFQTALDEGNDDMDDATATNLRVLKLKGEQIIHDNEAEIDLLCKVLTEK